MIQEQFAQFWLQLTGPLRAKWASITENDVAEINSNLAAFTNVVEKRYGSLSKEEVFTGANRRHTHWSWNYVGYKDPQPVS